MKPNRGTPPRVGSKRRGGGPRSAAGKAIASRNALRHGFSATLYRRPPAPERIERLAQAIAGEDRDPAVIAQAIKIAENEVLLSDIAMHKVSVVERLREPYANPFASKDNSLQLATGKLMQAWLTERQIGARVPALLEKYELRLIVEALAKRRADYAAKLERELQILFPEKAERAAVVEEWVNNMVSSSSAELKSRGWRTECDDIVPVRLKALLEEPDEPAQSNPAKEAAGSVPEERNEYEALEAAVRDLLRLDRYERRACSRQKRAILELANIKLVRHFAQKAGAAHRDLGSNA